MEKIDYEMEVKKVYPDAKCIGIGLNNSKPIWQWVIGVGMKQPYCDTKENAWKTIYNTLIQQGKITPKTK